jgi:polyhydroxyalkanoate synthesis regulator phasin
MKKIFSKSRLLVLLAVVLMMVGLTGFAWQKVNAGQTLPTALSNSQEGFYADEGEDPEGDDEFADSEEEIFYEIAADVIGLSIDELFAQLDLGKSIANVAQNHNVEPQTVLDALRAEENRWIDELVSAGELSAEEAEEWRADVDEYTTFAVHEVVVDPYILAAKTIGVDEDGLWEALDQGSSIADVALANGVALQTVVDALISAENDSIDQMVASGLLLDDEAEEWRAEIEEYVTYTVHEVYVDPFDIAAGVLGIDPDALWAEIDAGKTLAMIAVDQQVDLETVIAALSDSENSQINRMLDAGILSVEEAEEWRAEIGEYVDEIVHDAFDDDGYSECDEDWTEEEYFEEG